MRSVQVDNPPVARQSTLTLRHAANLSLTSRAELSLAYADAGFCTVPIRLGGQQRAEHAAGCHAAPARRQTCRTGIARPPLWPTRHRRADGWRVPPEGHGIPQSPFDVNDLPRRCATERERPAAAAARLGGGVHEDARHPPRGTPRQRGPPGFRSRSCLTLTTRSPNRARDIP
jgi:hypothetical protein